MLLDSAIPSPQRRPRIGTELAFLMTIWTLGNQNSYRDIADRFGISKGAAVSTVLLICKHITKMSMDYIQWPSRDEAKVVIEKFNHLRGRNSFPNVIGCIDGMHIQIPAPCEDVSSYYNRKGFHSLILQVKKMLMRFLRIHLIISLF